MTYKTSSFGQCWAVGQTCELGADTVLAYFSSRQEAQSMVERLDSTRDSIPVTDTCVVDTYAVHSNVGLAELHVKFDGPSIRFTIEHDGDSEVTLTKQKFDRWMSMMQSMADLHFSKFQ